MSDRTELDWDDGNWLKCQSHGVSIEEIQTVFFGEPYIVQDEKHSTVEDRYLAIGPNGEGRLVFIIFTRRSVGARELVRPVSTRYMHRKEIVRYEYLWRAQGSKNVE